MTRRPSRRMRLLLSRRIERRKFRKWLVGEIRHGYERGVKATIAEVAHQTALKALDA